MRRIASVAVAVIAVCGGSAASASAATEFGDNCVANQVIVPEESSTGAATFVALTAAGDPLALVAPSGGVITEWKVNSALPGSATEVLKVLQPTGGLGVRVVGESTGIVGKGSFTFPARIPIQAGDRLALYLHHGSDLLYCDAETENQLGYFEGAAEVGSSHALTVGESKTRLPVTAIVEPDVDGDGFGDETQDQCPQSAATQGPCSPPILTAPAPTPVSLSASAKAKRGSVTVLIDAGAEVSVTVAGTVKVGGGKTVRLSGGTQIVAPGTLARFVLLFPKALKARLAELGPKASLSLHLTATAPIGSGPPSSTHAVVKLAGQARARNNSS